MKDIFESLMFALIMSLFVFCSPFILVGIVYRAFILDDNRWRFWQLVDTFIQEVQVL